MILIFYLALTLMLSFFAALYAVIIGSDESFHEVSILPWHIAMRKDLNVFGIVLYSLIALFSFPFLWVVEFFIWLFTDACLKNKR